MLRDIFFKRYHASLKFDCAPILKQDCTSAACTALVVYQEAVEGEEPRAPPAFADPNAAAAGGKGGKAPAKGAVEFEPEDDAVPDPHPFEEAERRRFF